MINFTRIVQVCGEILCITQTVAILRKKLIKFKNVFNYLWKFK